MYQKLGSTDMVPFSLLAIWRFGAGIQKARVTTTSKKHPVQICILSEFVYEKRHGT